MILQEIIDKIINRVHQEPMIFTVNLWICSTKKNLPFSTQNHSHLAVFVRFTASGFTNKLLQQIRPLITQITQLKDFQYKKLLQYRAVNKFSVTCSLNLHTCSELVTLWVNSSYHLTKPISGTKGNSSTLRHNKCHRWSTALNDSPALLP